MRIAVVMAVLALAASASPGATCVQSGGTWKNTAISGETSTFTATWSATPNSTGVDSVLGFSSGSASAYTNLAAIVRFNTSGTVDVRNGSNYTASSSVSYSAGKTYQLRMVVNPASHTYSVFITPPGGSQVQLAANYAFRSEQARTSSLNNWAVYTDTGSENYCSLSVTAGSSSGAGSGSTTSPSITTQPSNVTVTTGQTATFSVVAAGTAPLSYQWSANGASISGAISASYTTPATTSSNNGEKFAVVVTNSAGSVTSSSATLTVTAASSPAISWSPSTLGFGSVDVGSSSTLPVTISSTGTATVTISGDSISGPGFTASANPALSGLMLSPGQTATLNVTFAPAATGSDTGSVTIASNAANQPSGVVTLSGSGVTAPVSHYVTLSWQASPSTVVGYDVFRGTVSGGPYTQLNDSPVAALTYTDNAVTAGDTYYYVVTAVNSAGVQSADSNQASGTIP